MRSAPCGLSATSSSASSDGARASIRSAPHTAWAQSANSAIRRRPSTMDSMPRVWPQLRPARSYGGYGRLGWHGIRAELDPFDPSDCHYECSAVCHEQGDAREGVCGAGFAFDCIPTRRYAANSAWQLLRVLAFNLMRGFQMVTTAERRGAKRKRRSRFRFETIHTLHSAVCTALASSSPRTAAPPCTSDCRRPWSTGSPASTTASRRRSFVTWKGPLAGAAR